MADQTREFVFANFRGGIQDREAVQIPYSYLRDVQNMRVSRGSLLSRGGRIKRYSSQFGGGNPIQSLHQYWDEDGNKVILIVANGIVYRDDMDGSDPTGNDITGAMAGLLSTSKDARYSFVDHDNRCYGTEGVAEPFYIPSQTGDAALYSDRIVAGEDDVKVYPTRMGVLEAFRHSLFSGDYKDFGGAKPNRPYGTIHTNPLSDDPIEYDSQQGPRMDYNRRFQVRGLHEHDMRTMLIYLRKGIWWAEYAPVAELGRARSDFAYDRLTPRVGLAAKYGVVVTPEGTYHVDNDGIYAIRAGYPPLKPQYVGKPIETFWGTIRKTRRPFICGVEDVENNGVLFCVPVGSTQINNNRGLYFNYESWSEEGLELQDAHPAYSIFRGARQSTDFGFNCLASIEDTDGRQRIIAGGYDGFVYTLDQGITDDGTAYTASFKLPNIGTPGQENHWHELIMDTNLNDSKSITIVQRNYDVNVVSSESFYSGTAGTVLGEFLLDTSVLSSGNLGGIRADLFGESRYTELEVTLNTGFPFNVHGLLVRAKRGRHM